MTILSLVISAWLFTVILLVLIITVAIHDRR